ncbi:MAG TPA: hypothetical protein VKV40_20855 [Ktedonobacteraceae bacterium]|nr:hypothetical protein [Ktedonobacteraceae bacterium]
MRILIPHGRMRRVIYASVLLVAILTATAAFVRPVVTGATETSPTMGRQLRNQDFQTHTLQQLIASHQLASTVQVLDSQPPTTIIQFPLFPSGVKQAFPKATGVVTVVEGNPEVSLFDTVTVDVANMPPDTTFTIFFIEHATKPFGNAEYVSDLHTRDDGSGDVTFQTITLVAFAMNSDNPGTSTDQSGLASGIQLEHLGMWFSSLQDAQKALNDNTLKGTPFDGGNPPLHAGPQALTDGQTAPVF